MVITFDVYLYKFVKRPPPPLSFFKITSCTHRPKPTGVERGGRKTNTNSSQIHIVGKNCRCPGKEGVKSERPQDSNRMSSKGRGVRF